ncbi:MAG: ABC transporter ATP-binding protein [Chryseolinea sp.]
MNTTLLTTSDLSIGYHHKVLLTGLNLSLSSGKLVCFMGPNGVGKSTLIRTLAGLQKPLSGSIKIEVNFKNPVSVVLTDKVHLFHMTVADLVTLGRYPYLNWNARLTSADENVIKQSLDQVNMLSMANNFLHELSDGQYQLVMIARALAQDTPIILLDEPTAHLDLNNRLEIMNLLRQLARTMDRAILVATHELDLALQTADEVWLAGNNKKILSGIAEDLVLNGTFDEIFGLKGFDLKTGRVMHHSFRSRAVRLLGEGYAYRWTRNALERDGYEVNDAMGSPTVSVKGSVNTYEWSLDDQEKFTSIHELLHHLSR